MSEINISSENEQLTTAAIITVVQDVLRRWYLILAAAVMAALLAFVYVDFTYTPVYKTTATFVVSSASTTSTTYTNLSSATNTAAAFTEVFNSSILRQKVLKEMDMPYFDGKITAEVAPDTNLLVMSVTGSDPRSVFLMSKGVIEHHHVVSEKALAGIVMELLDAPDAPVRPINSPDTFNKVTKAAMFAAVVVAGIIMALSYLSDRIRSRKEADTKLSCHVLGELYHERKNKTLKGRLTKNKRSILITDPLTSFIYTESVHKLAGRVDRHRHKGEHIIMVTSVLENEGKSTVAANLALSMAKKGKKILLIDCDLRRPKISRLLDQLRPDYVFGAIPIFTPHRNMLDFEPYRANQQDIASLSGFLSRWGLDAPALLESALQNTPSAVLRRFREQVDLASRFNQPQNEMYLTIHPDCTLYYGNTGAETRCLGDLRHLDIGKTADILMHLPGNRDYGAFYHIDALSDTDTLCNALNVLPQVLVYGDFEGVLYRALVHLDIPTILLYPTK